MLKQSFFNRQQSAITALIQAKSMTGFLCQARTAEFEGADAIAIELCHLPLEERTEENFRGLMNAVKLPFMFVDYRNDDFLKDDDEARQEYLLRAAAAGAEVIDVMGDLYDPSPRELTRKKSAVAKQKKLIERIHSFGAKALISSHLKEALTAEELLEHAQTQIAHGAEIAKIVTQSNSEEQFLETLRGTMLLNKELKVPFIHLSSGAFGRVHRFLGPSLGSVVEFAVQGYQELHVFPQPTIRSFKAVMENLHWQLPEK